MRCPGCGAEMHLIEVAPDKTKMVSGYEQHTFECSGCRDHVRQLVFIPRAIEPLNSEEMRLSAAWLETLNKGPIPKGDEFVMRCPNRVATQGRVRLRDANSHCGSGLTDNLGPGFERASG
jgi:hypothetical protein